MLMIRPAGETDASSVYEVAKYFPRQHSEDVFHVIFSEALRDSSRCILVAQASSEIAGYLMGLDETRFGNDQTAKVKEVMVAASWRRQGIGRLLMEGFENWARQRGCAVVLLGAMVPDFYKALGYEKGGLSYRKVL